MSLSGIACHPSVGKERKKERKDKICTLVSELNHRYTLVTDKKETYSY